MLNSTFLFGSMSLKFKDSPEEIAKIDCISLDKTHVRDKTHTKIDKNSNDVQCMNIGLQNRII